MGKCAFRRMVVGLLLLIVPASLFAADNGAAAMLYADGAAWLNGSHVPKSSAIFAGDLVQTRSDSAANIHAAGASITVFGDSLVQFEGYIVEGGTRRRKRFHVQGSVYHGRGCSSFAIFRCVDRIQRHRY